MKGITLKLPGDFFKNKINSLQINFEKHRGHIKFLQPRYTFSHDNLVLVDKNLMNCLHVLIKYNQSIISKNDDKEYFFRL